jgi:hypothetical protein
MIRDHLIAILVGTRSSLSEFPIPLAIFIAVAISPANRKGSRRLFFVIVVLVPGRSSRKPDRQTLALRRQDYGKPKEQQ